MRSSSLVFTFFVGLLSIRSAFADGVEGRRPPQNEAREADEMRFQALVKEGARAFEQGRLGSRRVIRYVAFASASQWMVEGQPARSSERQRRRRNSSPKSCDEQRNLFIVRVRD